MKLWLDFPGRDCFTGWCHWSGLTSTNYSSSWSRWRHACQLGGQNQTFNLPIHHHYWWTFSISSLTHSQTVTGTWWGPAQQGGTTLLCFGLQLILVFDSTFPVPKLPGNDWHWWICSIVICPNQGQSTTQLDQARHLKAKNPIRTCYYISLMISSCKWKIASSYAASGSPCGESILNCSFLMMDQLFNYIGKTNPCNICKHEWMYLIVDSRYLVNMVLSHFLENKIKQQFIITAALSRINSHA